jgi:hypothetical protein
MESAGITAPRRSCRRNFRLRLKLERRADARWMTIFRLGAKRTGAGDSTASVGVLASRVRAPIVAQAQREGSAWHAIGSGTDRFVVAGLNDQGRDAPLLASRERLESTICCNRRKVTTLRCNFVTAGSEWRGNGLKITAILGGQGLPPSASTRAANITRRAWPRYDSTSDVIEAKPLSLSAASAPTTAFPWTRCAGTASE